MKLINYKITLVFVLFILISLIPQLVQAGFGISPPYVWNDNLTRGSVYEQKIVIVRGADDTEEPWRITLTTELGKAEKWISIDKGMDFVMPVGETNVSIIVRVDVPQKAKYDNYKGKIRLKAVPDRSIEEGGVSIALGTVIDVDLNVSENKIYDFKVINVKLQDIEAGYDRKWFGFKSGIIKFAMNIENIGNAKVAPEKVILDIYNSTTNEFLESLENYNRLTKVRSFTTDNVLAKFKTKLPVGGYKVIFKIYKEDKIVREGDSYLSILPPGTLPKEATPVWVWIILGLVVLGVVSFIFKKKILGLIRKLIRKIKLGK